MGNETLPNRPLPNRPKNGWLAWQATIGHISINFSRDAMLTVFAYPDEGEIRWGARASWGQVDEHFDDAPAFGGALRELWSGIAQRYNIFNSLESAVKQPVNYAEKEWLDKDTDTVLQRLLTVTAAAFQDRWKLTIFYHPVERPNDRVAVLLKVAGEEEPVGGRGASLLDACRELFSAAARLYAPFTHWE